MSHSKLQRKTNLSKIEERARVFPEVIDVEHGLWVGQIRKVAVQSCIDAVLAPEIRNATRNRHLQSFRHNLVQLNTKQRRKQCSFY